MRAGIHVQSTQKTQHTPCIVFNLQTRIDILRIRYVHFSSMQSGCYVSASFFCCVCVCVCVCVCACVCVRACVRVYLCMCV